jgi:cardiolipin synthase A/B
MRTGFVEAAKRGVDVQVLLPEDSKHATVDRPGRRHLHGLLQAAVRIFRYSRIVIHSRTATMDGVWSTVS